MYDYKMSNPKCTAQRMCKVTKSSPKFQIYFHPPRRLSIKTTGYLVSNKTNQRVF